jgi:hypothetical protein
MQPALASTNQLQEQTIRTLRDDIAELQRKINDVTAARAARGGGRSDIEDRMVDEQLQAKDARAAQLRAEINEEKGRAEQANHQVRNQVHEYEAEHASLKLEEQKVRTGVDQTEVTLLANSINKAEEENRQLQAQLQRLEANKFISNTDERKVVNQRLAQLEEVLTARNSEYERLFEVSAKSEQDRLAIIQKRALMEEKGREMRTRSERLKLEVEQQAIDIQKVETEMRLMRERLPYDKQLALESTLTAFVNSQAATFARFERPEKSVPSALDLTSEGNMNQIIELLGKERDDLKERIQGCRREMDYESALSRDLKGLQLQELDDVRQKSRNALLDREKWERIAAIHLQTIQDLDKKMKAF